MTRDATTAFARTLVDEWVRCGVTHAVIAPGSRSAPLAYAIVDDRRLTTHVMLDERAAAFLALGLGRATGCPAVVLTTSGTAAANLHPAVLEAHHGSVPLLVCTADRPPEARGSGAPQTIDQVRLFGGAVRWFVDTDVPRISREQAPCGAPSLRGRLRKLAVERSAVRQVRCTSTFRFGNPSCLRGTRSSTHPGGRMALRGLRRRCEWIASWTRRSWMRWRSGSAPSRTVS